jgi:hypothetical protein
MSQTSLFWCFTPALLIDNKLGWKGLPGTNINLFDPLVIKEEEKSFITLAPSSCSTIYIDDSTVSNPNLKNTIKCVSLAIYYLIKNRKSNVTLEIFDEKLHPLTVRSQWLVLLTCDDHK